MAGVYPARQAVAKALGIDAGQGGPPPYLPRDGAAPSTQDAEKDRPR